MIIDILTLFPGMFNPVLQESILKRAQEKKKVKINIHNLRRWTTDKRKTVDDRPFGGGPGMVLKPEPIFEAIDELKQKTADKIDKVILLSPKGKMLKQETAKQLSGLKHLVLISGHYEGIDERVVGHLVDEEISIGDYVLTCGELPAMVLIDAVVRLIPDVLGDKDSKEIETFTEGLLEYPQYTRPRVYRGLKVPEILLTGDHVSINKWRKKQAILQTRKKRPDLFLLYKNNY
ncbi:MAG: tRNA (guanosine(37)-N1)-methyltransferase TrmD [Candidatus Omnitrophota bacterium]